MPKFYVLEQIRCAVTFVRQIEAADEEDALEMDCHVSGEAVGFHLGDTMGDTMEFFALPADPANLPQPFHPEALPLVPSAAPPVPSDAPALAGPDYAFAVAAGWAKVERDPSPDRCEEGPVWYHAELDRAMPLDTSCRDLCREVGGDEEEEPADPVKADMLAALIAIRDDLKAGGWDGLYDEARQIGISGAMSLVVAAIARAEGRA